MYVFETHIFMQSIHALHNFRDLGLHVHMDVSKNRGTSKRMVKIMENPIKMDDLGAPLFLETTI